MRGDKGDGTPAGRAEAKLRWAWANAGHIADVVRCSAIPFIYEFKCLTPFLVGGALGHGSQQHGGAPSTADGHRYAFGCTEEDQRRKNYGLLQIGQPSQPPFDRATGHGHVAWGYLTYHKIPQTPSRKNAQFDTLGRAIGLCANCLAGHVRA